ncbi:hypothetical protein L4D76_19695 [Photobacterium sagamiensis]
MSYPMPGNEFLNSGKRFAITMMEYSWLVQRSGAQDEYADWDKVLDEVVERGYEAIRLDVFPHILKNHKDGDENVVTFKAVEDSFMWGHHRKEVTVDVQADLIEFMKKCKDRGIYFPSNGNN